MTTLHSVLQKRESLPSSKRKEGRGLDAVLSPAGL